ncbi:MAG: cytochrome ubiquinol oxidase subunit I [Actinomycetota bacterium]
MITAVIDQAGGMWLLAAGAEPAQLIPARMMMAFTLGFHIILVPFGVAFTALMMVANYRAIRRDDADALRLAQRWSKVAAVLFAVGAVSGTVLSFEMGLLWPGLMDRFGAAYGIAFAVEGIFFFLEAIYISIYIYGWKRLRPWPHFWTGLPVVLSGVGGTASVVAANAWMNLPAGFTLREGRVVDVRPLEVFFTDAFWYQNVHMLLAAYIVAGYVTAGVYAAGMLRGRRDRYHRLGFLIPFVVGSLAIPLQVLVGDIAAREVFEHEPAKFAAIELVTETARNVPETIGGVLVGGEVKYGIRIPGGASLLAGLATDTEIRGLDAIPAEVRPANRLVNVVHLSFQAMVGISFALLALSVWFASSWWRRRDLPRSPWFLRGAAAAGVLSVVALEAGWVVTEVGRQPWTVVGHLLTRDAVTRSGNVWLFFAGTFAIYAVLGVATVLVLRGMRQRWQQADDDFSAVPYGPPEAEGAAATATIPPERLP